MSTRSVVCSYALFFFFHFLFPSKGCAHQSLGLILLAPPTRLGEQLSPPPFRSHPFFLTLWMMVLLFIGKLFLPVLPFLTFFDLDYPPFVSFSPGRSSDPFFQTSPFFAASTFPLNRSLTTPERISFSFLLMGLFPIAPGLFSPPSDFQITPFFPNTRSQLFPLPPCRSCATPDRFPSNTGNCPLSLIVDL